MNDKTYIFYDSYRPTSSRRPHHYCWIEKLGDKRYYSHADILKLDEFVCTTTFNKLLTLKPGTGLKLHYLHSCGNLMIRLLTKEEIELLKLWENTKGGIEQINKAIKAKCPNEFKFLSALQKQERNLKKTAKKLNFDL
jgi:hypothetical protein